MIRRSLCSMLVCVFAAPTLGAQIGRQRPTAPSDPGYWVGLSIGYVEGITTTDDATGATWRFGYTSQLRATVEKTLSQGVTLGVAAGYASAPLTYSSAQFGGACPSSCLANADITQYLAFVRGGSGRIGTGFHGSFAVEGGVTQFSKFRDRTTKTSLPPSSGSNDLTLGFGTGFGYRMSQLSEIYVDQSYDFVFHKQSSAVTNQSVPRLLTFRGGIRFGF
jgi:hypothetical protein